MPNLKDDFNRQFMLDGFDFNQIDFLDMLCCSDLGVLMTDDQGILIFYNATLKV